VIEPLPEPRPMRAAFCAARLSSLVTSTVDPGREQPPVFAELRPGPRPGVAHAPIVIVAVSAEIARDVARHTP
jgi:hypothetical protein